jgi:UV DNA damage endonuclease
MVRWNDHYNIKFFRLSSEMFPFASHPEYGYKLAPFASEALAEVGKIVAELGHRVTTHPGQFTQFGSPRQPVIENAIRDLDYHDELLTLLKLPEQLDRDAVMILHMGGIFDGKEQTLQRFRENYVKLSQSVKNRLVLENDDMGWSVHDLLPICEELNIPLVLDFHHHNIVFDASQIREGTADIVDLFPRIMATWERKGIKPKMHYSEQTSPAITPRQRRKHSPRVATMPPCPPDMDLMIEAKDKEQAVFELMRTFKLPGFEKLNDVIPYIRTDDNKAADTLIKKASRKSKKAAEEKEPTPELILEEKVGMGGSEGRVYWPPGMEEWLRPKKREVKKKDPGEKTAVQIKKEKQAIEIFEAKEAEKARERAEVNGAPVEADEESDEMATPATKKAKAAMKKKAKADAAKIAAAAPAPSKASRPKIKVKKEATIPSPPSEESEELVLDDEDEEQAVKPAVIRPSAGGRQPSRRRAKKVVSYNDDNEDVKLEDA